MAEQKQPTRTSAEPAPALFHRPTGSKHPRLFLQKYLAEDAARLSVDPAEMERVGAILKQWATLWKEGHLDRKETEIDADFLQKIFGDALGYKSVSDSPLEYQREKNPTIPG